MYDENPYAYWTANFNAVYKIKEIKLLPVNTNAAESYLAESVITISGNYCNSILTENVIIGMWMTIQCEGDEGVEGTYITI